MSDSNIKYRAPLIASKILELFLPQDSKEYLLGDFEAIYLEKVEKKGIIYAHLWYWIQILINAPIFVFNSIQWGFVMFNNYLKVTFRTLKRNKLFSIINIGGLAIGLTAFSLILTYIFDETSYDKFFKDSDRLYRISNNLKTNDTWSQLALTPPAWAEYIKKDFPEVEANVLTNMRFNTKVSGGDNKFTERAFYVSENYFDILSFPLLSGDPKTALIDPTSVVITETLANKLFGKQDVIGKHIKIEDKDEYQITAVLKELPKHSSIKFDLLLSMNKFGQSESGRNRLSDMIGSNFYNYVKFVNDADIKAFEEKIKTHFTSKVDWPSHFQVEPFIEKLSDVYLYSDVLYQQRESGSITNIYVMSGVAVFILLMAGINFTNLTTSSSVQKAKEIGIRKVTGGNRSDIVAQLIGDSVIISIISLILALIAIPFVLPFFNELAGKQFVVGDFLNFTFLSSIITIAIVTGLIAGLYPAIYLSSFDPAKILKGEVTKGKSTALFRKALVVVQFVASIVLIITTLILTKQLDFLRFKDIGFNKDNIVYLPLNSKEIKNNCETLRSRLINDENIITASVSSRVMGSVFSGWSMTNDKNIDQSCVVLFADENICKVFNIKFVKGRGFSTEHITDKGEAYIINETAAKKLSYEDPIGRYIKIGDEYEGKIIGVMKDFNFKSLNHKIEPLVIKYYTEYGFSRKFINIKVAGGKTKEAINSIKNIYAEFAPETEFNPQFIDEHLNSLYQNEEELGKTIKVFSVLAIFIGCLGLFGLSSFAAIKRRKEIGIRKVLGSSIFEIGILLIKDFAYLVLIAIFLAIPISYFIGDFYLRSYPYKTTISADLFIYGSLLAFFLAIVTVLYHAIKTSLTNPVESIKYE